MGRRGGLETKPLSTDKCWRGLLFVGAESVSLFCSVVILQNNGQL